MHGVDMLENGANHQMGGGLRAGFAVCRWGVTSLVLAITAPVGV